MRALAGSTFWEHPPSLSSGPRNQPTLKQQQGALRAVGGVASFMMAVDHACMHHQVLDHLILATC